MGANAYSEYKKQSLQTLTPMEIVVKLYDEAEKQMNLAIIDIGGKNYAGANKAKPGSWGAYLAYRHLGNAATAYSTYTLNGPQYGGEKGWEI
ncbi:MAG: flagellar protein FliS, partial [Ruminiclostridium sp.]|nr:flagellar protein FliS [Ruminiclostridium sp.]